MCIGTQRMAFIARVNVWNVATSDVQKTTLLIIQAQIQVSSSEKTL